MKKRSSPKRSAQKSPRRAKKQFTKSWLDEVKLDDLSVLADLGGDDGCPGGSDGGDDLSIVSFGGPTINGVPDPAICDYSWSICCPCGTFLGQDSYFGMSACCDDNYMVIIGINGGQSWCATEQAQGWIWGSGDIGNRTLANNGVSCNDDGGADDINYC